MKQIFKKIMHIMHILSSSALIAQGIGVFVGGFGYIAKGSSLPTGGPPSGGLPGGENEQTYLLEIPSGWTTATSTFLLIVGVMYLRWAVGKLRGKPPA